ncbi:conserved hypothetical protein [Luminiphilus syltensis NOR5-1B]|uniref:ChrR-like cupin domain-containing protein n=1 Tax=Luminiphilus syltensis NOR5-1B TaxID=565045 RepID=B8KTY8_9GAMM|nr:cupin domain-containing protein [Luminiphilus syltensis]EED34960.1 conserved hypothetical protein [Luminiphilus syltensis NOR5-1B]
MTDLTDPHGLGDIVVKVDDKEWCDLGGGTQFKLLRCNMQSGEWTLYVRMEAGAAFAPHRHLSNSEYYVTKGELLYDVGSAPAGTYGYEPIGSIHTQARCEIDTEMIFMGRGAVAFTGDEGEIRFILDNEFLRDVTTGDVNADIS